MPDVVEGFVQPGALCLCSACGVGEDLGNSLPVAGRPFGDQGFGLWLIRGRSLLTYGLEDSELAVFLLLLPLIM